MKFYKNNEIKLTINKIDCETENQFRIHLESEGVQLNGDLILRAIDLGTCGGAVAEVRYSPSSFLICIEDVVLFKEVKSLIINELKLKETDRL